MKVHLIQQMRTPWPSRFIFGDAPITSFSEISLGGILIQHPEGYVLVDNGLSLGPGFEYTDQIMTAAEGYKFIAGTFLKSFGDKIPFLKTVIKDEYLDMLKAVKTPLRIKPSVSSQLKTHGIKLDDIKHIVFTHLHYDHVGDISQFKRARVWVSQKEMRAAQHPLAFFNGYNPLIAQWDYRTERILDPLVIKPEVAPFSIVKDLFGDGKVLILSTPGHTQGSLSVLVRDEDKKYFLCGDACYCRESYREERSPGRIGLYGFDHNPRLAETTRNKIMKWEQTTPELEVIPIHDTNIWSEDQLFPLPWSGS